MFFLTWLPGCALHFLQHRFQPCIIESLIHRKEINVVKQNGVSFSDAKAELSASSRKQEMKKLATYRSWQLEEGATYCSWQFEAWQGQAKTPNMPVGYSTEESGFQTH